MTNFNLVLVIFYFLLELVDTVVELAEEFADAPIRSDGRDVKLEEDIQLQLPFLLPEEGYSCDIIRGVPPGLQEFLDPLAQTGNYHQYLFTSFQWWRPYV